MVEIHTREEQDTFVVELEGRLDAFHAPTVRDALIRAVEQGHIKIAVDLAKVTFMDSTGLAALVAGMFRAREQGGDLRLACVREPVCVIFELTHMDTTFVLTDNVGAAIESFSEA